MILFSRFCYAPKPKEIGHLLHEKFTPQMSRVVTLISLCLIIANVAAQNLSSTPPKSETQNCAALVQLNLEGAPEGPALITSAHLVDVPASGLEQWPISTSGYG